jgi:tetratricopeptide (TPR) repeat protein
MAVYGPALWGGILWDDIGHITRPDLQPLSGLWRIWFEVGATQQYYPVVHSAFWLFHHLWGGATLGYHVVNVTLHAISAVLLVRLVRRFHAPGAVLAGVIFLIHPVEVESVAWITELKNTLSTPLYLAAALAYLRFDDGRSRRAYAAALTLFACAVLSKTVTATLPAALLVGIWFLRGRLRWALDVRPLLPMFVIGISGGLATAWFEHAFIGARGAEYAFGPIARVLIAGRVVWFYLWKLVWPANLMFIYPRWTIDANVWWQYAFPLAALLVLALFWRWRHRTRAPLAAALLFGGTLVPALGFVNVYPFRYSFVADHFQYLASMFVIAFAAAALLRVTPKRRLAPGRAEWMLMLLLGVPLAARSWQQSHDYVNMERLFEVTLARNPDCWMCHHNLAGIRTEQRNEAAAMRHLAEAVRLNPTGAVIRYDRAVAYTIFNHYQEAVPEFQEAVRLNPSYALAHQYLGSALMRIGRPDEARRELEIAIRLSPGSALAHAELGLLLMQTGDAAGALRHLTEALRLQPDAADVHAMLADVYRALDRQRDAIVHDREAMRLDPSVAEYYNSLASDLMQAGQPEEALAMFRAALARDPNASAIHLNAATALASVGQTDAAATEFREVLRLDPTNAVAAEWLRAQGERP